MWLVTAEQMQSLDRRTIQEAHVPGITLMERAGQGVVEHLISAWGSPKGHTILIVCGKGNNGGDGFVVARLLHKKGAKVHTILLSSPKELSPDAKTMYRRLTQLAPSSRLHIQPSSEKLQSLLEGGHVIVDAMLGTGLTSTVREPYLSAIELINLSSGKVAAIDIPSGLDSNNGTVLGSAVNADLTVTFGYPKVGLYLGTAIDRVGQVHVVDIGIPTQFASDLSPRIQLLTQDRVRQMIPARPPTAHKGTFGHAGLLAGSPGKTGAAAMAGLSALRIGTGLVTIACPHTVSPVLEAKLLEVMTDPMPDSPQHQLGMDSFSALRSFMQNKSALGVGPGLGVSEDTTALLIKLLPQSDIPCLLDADALNGLAGHPEVFSATRVPPILTPHPGEMARLMGEGYSANTINQDRLTVATRFAQEHRAIVVLKGARTIVAEPGGQIAICPTGNPGMASAGMGDVLTGMITGLLAQGVASWDAAQVGVYVHGLAGDLAAARLGYAGLIASDVISAIPQALQTILETASGDNTLPSL
ncbi:MAG: NAD(P)H-hydrate dehydratase [Nitrospirales bacterium]|nr:NAD(P)H-hydrate dehydratase [Nitrospirales bacterium]